MFNYIKFKLFENCVWILLAIIIYFLLYLSAKYYDITIIQTIYYKLIM